MEEQTSKTLNAKQVVLIFATIIGIVFIILLVITIYNALKPNPYGDATSIDGLSATGISKDDQDRITANLYTMIKNHSATDADIPTSGAKVREGSISKQYDETEKINTVDFVVDIESIRQSYNIHVEWSNDKNSSSGYPYVIRCLDDSQEKIYPEFACTDDFTASDYEAINSYLPYWGKTKNGYDYTIKMQKYTDGEKYLEVDIDSCGDKVLMDEALESAKSWVESQGLEQDAFPYYVPDDLCEGGEAM